MVQLQTITNFEPTQRTCPGRRELAGGKNPEALALALGLGTVPIESNLEKTARRVQLESNTVEKVVVKRSNTGVSSPRVRTKQVAALETTSENIPTRSGKVVKNQRLDLGTVRGVDVEVESEATTSHYTVVAPRNTNRRNEARRKKSLRRDGGRREVVTLVIVEPRVEAQTPFDSLSE